MSLGTARSVKRAWSLFTKHGSTEDPMKVLYEEFNSLCDAVENVETLINQLRTAKLTGLFSGNPGFAIDTNFDVQNANAYQVIKSGVVYTIAANQTHDTGTSTIVSTAAGQLWAAGILSVDADATAYVDWGAEAADEATAIAAFDAVTVSGEVVVGYVTFESADGEDWVAGTDALTTGSGGQVATTTNYYSAINPDATLIGSAIDISSVQKLATVESGD